MKILKCNKCKDMIALRMWNKSCKCGECKGKFVEDGRTISISGDCTVLGFPNDAFFEIKEPNEFVKRA